MDVMIPPVFRSVFCGAARRQGEGSCRRPSGWGTDHSGVGRCKLHGGCTPTHGRHAATSIATRVAQLFGVPREDINPIDGLTEELQRSAGLIDSYEAMCAQLLPEEVVFGVISEESTRTTDPDAADGTDLAPVETKTRRGAALNIWVRQLDRERDRFAKLCETMVKLDLESRRIAIDQSHVAVLVQVLLSGDLGLSDEQKRVAARMLRQLDAGSSVIEGEAVS